MKKKTVHVKPRPSILTRLGVSLDEQRAILALLPPALEAYSAASRESSELAKLEAQRRLADAETSRNLSALALFAWGPRDAESGK